MRKKLSPNSDKIMIKKTLNIILTAFAWMFGIAFALGGISQFFSGNILFAITLLLGAILLLPPVKNLIIEKIPIISRWMLTAIGSVIIFSSIGIFAPEPVVENAIAAKDDKQVVKEVDSDVETAWGKPIVPVDKVDESVPVPVPAIQQPKALLSQKNDKAENTYTSEPELKTNDNEAVKAAIEPEPVKIAEISSNDDCSGLPRTCSKMANCTQAKKALACGNSRLDKDSDGIPCESIC